MSGGDFWHDFLERPIIWEADDTIEVKPAANPLEAQTLDAARDESPAHHVDAEPEMQHDHATYPDAIEVHHADVQETHGTATAYDGHADHDPVASHDGGASSDASAAG